MSLIKNSSGREYEEEVKDEDFPSNGSVIKITGKQLKIPLSKLSNNKSAIFALYKIKYQDNVSMRSKEINYFFLTRKNLDETFIHSHLTRKQKNALFIYLKQNNLERFIAKENLKNP